MARVRITESLDIDLDTEKWCCHRCGEAMNSAREPFTRGALVYDKPAATVYGKPMKLSKDTTVSYAPDPDFMHVIEYYCPGCGALLNVHYLPPGHPIPTDILLDIDKLKEKHAGEAQPQP